MILTPLSQGDTVETIRIATYNSLRRSPLMERAYRNLGYVLLVLLPVFIAGFWIPYLSEIPRFDASITAAVHIHAALLFSFLLLLIIQPFLIRYGAFSAHRILGKMSNILIPFVLIFSVAMLFKEYHEHLSDGATVAFALNAEFLSAMQLLLFGTLYGLAIAAIRRREVPTHMRYMICIVLVLLPAGLARTMGYWFGVRQSMSQTICLALIDILLVALIVFDRRRQLHARPYIAVLLAYGVIEGFWIILGRPI